jgi:hypothetical protein
MNHARRLPVVVVVILISIANVLLLSPAGSFAADAPARAKQRPDVAAIYFPSWHTDDHYSSWYGENWNEWELIKKNPQRFPGQNTVKPADDWGYFDEADPKQMAKQIDLANQFGVDVFIFDWYWYSGVQILHRPVEETLPKTPNRDKIKYALMWADHTWVNYFPYPYDGPVNWLLPIRHTPANFQRVMQHCIERHFKQSNYWRVGENNAVYFSLFAPEDFIKQLGGAEKAKAVLDAARETCRKAGVGEVHFAAFTGIPQSIGDVKKAGFDSMTSYNVTTMSSGFQYPNQPFEEFEHFARRHEGYWDNMDTGVLPYGPVVTVGWDVTPRWELNVPWPPEKNHYPYTPIVINNTPEKFGDLVRRGLRQIESSKLKPPALFINSWNEWTEGSALLPQQKYGSGYLEQLKKALDAGPLPASDGPSKPKQAAN